MRDESNLTQKQRDAKRAFLDCQQAEMLARFEKADRSERRAVIRQIDSFLAVMKSKDERIFWLRFRQKLERLGEKTREATE